MKKACFLIPVAILVFILTSCTGKNRNLNLMEFESRIVATGPIITIEGSFCFKDSQNMRFVVASPEEIKGMTVSLSSGVLSAAFDDVTVSEDILVLCDDIYSPLFEAVSLLCHRAADIPNDGDGRILLQGTDGKITAELSYEEPRITYIENNGFSYSFSYSQNNG